MFGSQGYLAHLIAQCLGMLPYWGEAQIETPDTSGICPFCKGPLRCPPVRPDCEAEPVHGDEPWTGQGGEA